MKRVALLTVVVLSMGCGNDPSTDDSLQLSRGLSSGFNAADGSYHLGYSCDETGSSPLSKMTNQGLLPTLTLSFNQLGNIDKERLTNNSSKEQRCQEIIAYVLRNPELDFNFHYPDKDDASMAESGAKIPLKTQWVTLKYQDGTLNDHSVNINLRCETGFAGSCLGKECEGYLVHVLDEVCTFRASGTLFEFSNHKQSVIDLTGEIDFRAKAKPFFKITSLSVVAEH